MYEVYRMMEADGDIPSTFEVVATCPDEGWANDIAILLANEFEDMTFGYYKVTENPFKVAK